MRVVRAYKNDTQSQVLKLKWRTETVGKAIHNTHFNNYTDIDLALGRKTRTTESSERVDVEHRGTRARAGAMGEESFSPSPKVTVRRESLDAVESGRPGDGL